MNCLLIAALIMISAVITAAHEVLNGSFEDNTFTPPPWHENGCNFNGDCDYYHNNMAYSNAWETESIGNQNCFTGSIKENCHFSNQGPWGPSPQHGQWSVMIYGSHIQSSWGSYSHRANAISLALSQPLCIGETYVVSYYVKEIPQFPNHPQTYYTTSLSVGVSEKDTSFG